MGDLGRSRFRLTVIAFGVLKPDPIRMPIGCEGGGNRSAIFQIVFLPAERGQVPLSVCTLCFDWIATHSLI
ncbi:hypothetical protein CGZ80_07780 [Rhodopirellula sp. MGV]|nr:hypothetical protein CGZ80_07780 [Rhodopirellula sp. MGV]PNY34502.1 hypothetical protein C2E31_22595 [Rhodopirellula baltica]